jgi:putative membrane protein
MKIKQKLKSKSGIMKINKKKPNLLIYLFSMLMLAGSFSACSEDEVTPPGDLVSDQDRLFARDASYSNLAEIQMGELAASKGILESVREFGGDMVTEHTAAQTQLIDLASSLSIAIPDTLSAEHQEQYDVLENLEGEEFDRAYLALQVVAHQEAQLIFESEVDTGTNEQLQEYAYNTLQNIVMHLERAENLQNEQFPD